MIVDVCMYYVYVELFIVLKFNFCTGTFATGLGASGKQFNETTHK